VTAIPLDGPYEQHENVASLPDVAESVREFNSSSHAHEDLWARTHQAGDAVRHGSEQEHAARARAQGARAVHLAVQAEHPRRRAPLLRQLIIALITVGLDGVACWFAAQALGSDQVETLVWAGLFLVILAAGEVALDRCSESSRTAWNLLVVGLTLFVAGLGVLRFLYLATVGNEGAAAAVVGTALFTAATSGFLVIGYRALRAAETFPAWQARRRARRSDREAATASARLSAGAAERDRLVDAYMGRIRVSLLQGCTAGQLPFLEEAVREHLTGRDRP
jgi:hypothetical protein